MNGILKKARQAADENKIASYKEEIQLAYISVQGRNNDENTIFQQTKQSLEQTGKYSVTVYNDSATIISNNDKYVFEIVDDNTEYRGIQKVTTNAEPLMMARTNNYYAFWNEEIRTKITRIETRNYMVYDSDIIQEWDVSKNKDKSVIAYITDDGNSGYNLYIVANGKIKMQPDGKSFFENFFNVTQMDLKNLDTSALTTMENMFYADNSLLELNLSSFDTSNVTNMSNMFCNCKQLQQINFKNFDTSNAENMFNMFYGCTALTKLDLSSFNTSKVTNFSQMFRGCSSFEILDISSFTLDSLTTAVGMFGWCGKLKTIYANDKFTFNENISTANMFIACGKLVGGQGTTWKGNIDYELYAHIDGGPSNPGYFTYKTTPSNI
ncbi:MAG: BspA family leucine-rich repeat surface protein [Clostridia bacterium]|nr:BspA family leucine-rich repeat surface protein [Clostridia bacterium]